MRDDPENGAAVGTPGSSTGSGVESRAGADAGSPDRPRLDPDAYQVKLERFEGPLDLLLFLIKKEEVSIYDIPIARITEQYLAYIQRIPLADLDSAGEFLLMAATLMRIKARMLLPKAADEDESDEDPRRELVDRLLEYQKFKEAASALRGLEQDRSLFHGRGMHEPAPEGAEPEDFEPPTLFDLMKAFARVLERARHYESHAVELEEFSFEEAGAALVERLKRQGRVLFKDLFPDGVTRLRVVVTFVALLDLVRKREVEIGQERRFGEIWIETRRPS